MHITMFLFYSPVNEKEQKKNIVIIRLRVRRCKLQVLDPRMRGDAKEGRGDGRDIMVIRSLLSQG